jgi:hypothetical protein
MRVAVIVFGILLIIVGTGVLIYQGITITTLERQVLDLGPLTASTEEGYRTIPLPPIAGGIVLATGAVLILAAAMRTRRTDSGKLREAGSS